MNELKDTHKTKLQKASKSARGKATTGSPIAAATRWLTETRQYLAACAAVVTVAGTLWFAVAKARLPMEVLYAAPVPFLLVFCFTTLPRWLADRQKRWLISRISIAPDLGEAYFQIGPYRPSQRKRYQRADGAHRQMLEWFVGSRAPILILTGESGTGKSSLLEAYLVPELESLTPPFRVVKVRTLGRPEIQLREALLLAGAIWENPSQAIRALPTLELMKQATERARRGGKASRLAIVFDQFEEGLILREEAPKEFAALRSLFDALTAKPPAGLTILLALRSEYRRFLKDVGVSSDERTNWMELSAFSPSAAAGFLTAKESGLSIEEARLRHVLKEAAAVDGTRGLVRPIVLNMLGRILQRLTDSPEADKPTRALLMTDVRRAIERPELRAIARQVLPTLLTETDTKRQRTSLEIRQETNLDEQVVVGFLQEFGLSGYVREIGGESPAGNRWWEISHDFVARLVGQVIKTPTKSPWSRLKPVLYPLSVIAWAVAAVFLIFAGPRLDRMSTESQLEKRFGFAIQETPDGYVVTEQLYAFNDLAAASPYLKKLIPLNLSLSHCTQLTNVDELKGLTALRSLDLSSTEVDSVAALTRLSTLQTLNLRETKIWDIEPLTGLTALQSLDVSSTQIDDIEPLRRLSALQTLNLSGTRVGKLEALRSLATLKSLDLGMMQRVESFEPVKGLTALHALNLGYSNVRTLEFLRGLTALQDLGLNGINIGSLEVLNGLTALQSLSLTDSKFETLEPLKRLTRLHSLTARGVYIETLEPLKGLPSLQILDLGNTRIKDENLEPLRAMSSLQSLDLSFQNIESLEPLRGLASLQYLSLVATRVQNLEPLEDLTELRKLILPSTVPDTEQRRFKLYRREKRLPPVVL